MKYLIIALMLLSNTCLASDLRKVYIASTKFSTCYELYDQYGYIDTYCDNAYQEQALLNAQYNDPLFNPEEN